MLNTSIGDSSKLIGTKEVKYMKKTTVFPIIVVIIVIIGYYIFFNKSNDEVMHSSINLREVELLTINDKSYNTVKDAAVVKKIVSLYNKAKIFKKDADTTPSHIIVIQLKNGLKINIAGTTQSFHYVSVGEESYKISSLELS
jgi:hypothetical protein